MRALPTQLGILRALQSSAFILYNGQDPLCTLSGTGFTGEGQSYASDPQSSARLKGSRNILSEATIRHSPGKHPFGSRWRASTECTLHLKLSHQLRGLIHPLYVYKSYHGLSPAIHIVS